MKKFCSLLCILAILMTTLSITASAASAPDVDMKLLGDDGTTYLSTSGFDPDVDDYEIELDGDTEELYLCVYVDDTEDFTLEAWYGSEELTLYDVETYYYCGIAVEPDDLETLTVYVEDLTTGDYEIYYFYLYNDGSASYGAYGLEDMEVNLGSSYSSSYYRSLELYPAFDPDITEYTVLVPYTDSYTEATLRLTLEDVYADLEVEGTAVTLTDTSYDHTFALTEGSSVTVDFTVEGDTYTVNVYFADSAADDAAYLYDMAIRSARSSLSKYDLELDPDFDPDETSYELADADNYSTLYLYAEADSDKLIFIGDQLLTSSYWSFDPDDYDVITVTVFAEDLEEYEMYEVALVDGSTNYLTSISLSSSEGAISLSPVFDADRRTYVANVDNSVSAVYLTLGNGSNAEISFNEGSYGDYDSSDCYSLSNGLNTFDIRIGTTHYYVNVYRPSAYRKITTSSQYISIDGETSQRLAAYNINGNNFVKLRDLAYLLDGTDKQFSVDYDTASRMVILYSGSGYDAIGGELTIPGAHRSAVVTTQSIYLDGSVIRPMAYNIDGCNYILLRDMAALLDLGVSFSGTTAYLDTDVTYGGESSPSGDTFEVDLKLVGDDGTTYLSKSDFDPEETEYDVELDSEVETLYLYVYFDDDAYLVTVDYDGDTLYEDVYSAYCLYEMDVDMDYLDEITVVVEDENGDEMEYTIYLQEA